LDCRINQLSSLNVSANTALGSLSCNINQLTSIDVSSNKALRWLYCEKNKLTSLNVSDNTELNILSCSENQLTRLDVSACTALTELWCSKNSITNLNVSVGSTLRALVCDGNYLTNLDLSGATSLVYFHCEFNQLTSLNLKNGANKRLNNQERFWATGNPNLICVQVDDTVYANSYWRDDFPTGTLFRLNCSGVGINTIAQSKSLQVYPNPTTGNIYLSENSNILLTDLLGNLILEQKNINQLDILSLPSGMYFLRVGDNLKQIFKIIKE
jgi:hypothetical protein